MSPLAHHRHSLLLRKRRRISPVGQLAACPVSIQEPQPRALDGSLAPQVKTRACVSAGTAGSAGHKSTTQWSGQWLRDGDSCLGHVSAWVSEWNGQGRGQLPPLSSIPQPWITGTVSLVLERAPGHAPLRVATGSPPAMLKPGVQPPASAQHFPLLGQTSGAVSLGTSQ